MTPLCGNLRAARACQRALDLRRRSLATACRNRHMNPDLNLRARRLMGKRALVTGGASGIGFACARRLIAEGASVVLCDMRNEALENAKSQLSAGAHAIACDVGSAPAVEALVVRAVQLLGGLDIVVTCAGIVRSGPTHSVPLDQWDMVIRTNLTGTFLVLRHCIAHFLQGGGGAIVTIGSVSSVVAAGRTSAYDASKGGVLQLTRAVAVEYADAGIRANCVLPGLVRTSLAASSIELHGPMNVDTSKAPASRLRIPIERYADPDEIAAVSAFLASDDASFMTGAAVAVDGGYTAI
jgi:NAD(P)-dependent dehydrogenase (short-subunit alcohol dehydrogenase family)